MINIVTKEIEIGRWLVAEKLVNKHYHSVELFSTKEEKKYPVYRIGEEMKFAGVDDTKGRFSYTRITGSPMYLSTFSPGSCEKGYLLNVPMRIVIFSDYEKENRQFLIQRLLGTTFLQDVKFVKYSFDPVELAAEESPIGDFNFDGNTFYVAIDVTVRVVLQRDDCNENNCIAFPNPICN